AERVSAATVRRESDAGHGLPSLFLDLHYFAVDARLARRNSPRDRRYHAASRDRRIPRCSRRKCHPSRRRSSLSHSLARVCPVPAPAAQAVTCGEPGLITRGGVKLENGCRKGLSKFPRTHSRRKSRRRQAPCLLTR